MLPPNDPVQPPDLKGIPALVQSLVDFIAFLRKSWSGGIVLRLILLYVVAGVLTFPATIGFYRKFVTGNSLVPEGYATGYWLVVVLLGVALVVFAVTRPSPASGGPPPEPRLAIKGLAWYTGEDADLFQKLQRETQIREWSLAMMEPTFRLGVLVGVSGAGKTSLLHAGIAPELAKKNFRCIPIKFTQLDPLETIRSALQNTAGGEVGAALPGELLPLLEACFPAKGPPALLVFDQFEQFFVHHATTESRQPFLDAMLAWHQQKVRSSARIVLCVRDEFAHFLNRFVLELRHVSTQKNYFPLDMFSAVEAISVLQELATREKIPWTEACLKGVVQQLALARPNSLVASELIKPADVQMVADSIRRTADRARRRFTDEAIKALGGVEGLRREYLAYVLAPRLTDLQRQQALQVMLALTQGQTRIGVLQVETLQEKLKDVMSADDVQAAINFLAHPDNNLISQVEGANGYELTHETLIPAMNELAGKILPELRRAQQLLERRTKEWVDNGKSGRFLLSWREWRFIGRYPGLAQQVQNRSVAGELIACTSRRWRRFAIAGGCAALAAISAAFAVYSAPAYKYRLRRQLAQSALKDSNDSEVRAQAALSLLIRGCPKETRQLLADDAAKGAFCNVVGDLVDSPDLDGLLSPKDMASRPRIVAFLLDAAFAVTRDITELDDYLDSVDTCVTAAAKLLGPMRTEAMLARAAREIQRRPGDDPGVGPARLASIAASAASQTRNRGVFSYALKLVEQAPEDRRNDLWAELAVAAADAGATSGNAAFLDDAFAYVGRIGADAVRTQALTHIVTKIGATADAAGPFAFAGRAVEQLKPADAAKALALFFPELAKRSRRTPPAAFDFAEARMAQIVGRVRLDLLIAMGRAAHQTGYRDRAKKYALLAEDTLGQLPEWNTRQKTTLDLANLLADIAVISPADMSDRGSLPAVASYTRQLAKADANAFRKNLARGAAVAGAVEQKESLITFAADLVADLPVDESDAFWRATGIAMMGPETGSRVDSAFVRGQVLAVADRMSSSEERSRFAGSLGNALVGALRRNNDDAIFADLLRCVEIPPDATHRDELLLILTRAATSRRAIVPRDPAMLNAYRTRRTTPYQLAVAEPPKSPEPSANPLPVRLDRARPLAGKITDPGKKLAAACALATAAAGVPDLPATREFLQSAEAALAQVDATERNEHRLLLTRTAAIVGSGTGEGEFLELAARLARDGEQRARLLAELVKTATESSHTRVLAFARKIAEELDDAHHTERAGAIAQAMGAAARTPSEFDEARTFAGRIAHSLTRSAALADIGDHMVTRALDQHDLALLDAAYALASSIDGDTAAPLKYRLITAATALQATALAKKTLGSLNSYQCSDDDAVDTFALLAIDHDMPDLAFRLIDTWHDASTRLKVTIKALRALSRHDSDLVTAANN